VPNPFEEFISCQKDFSYFVSNYVKILHPTKGLIPFALYDFQKKLIELYESKRFVATIKFRQGGFSTLTAIYGLWLCMFHEDQSIFFACRTAGEAEHWGKIIKMAMNNFPEWFMLRMEKDTESEKIFAVTRSRMLFGCLERTRGCKLTHLIIDEAAFIPKMEEKWRACLPCISTDGKIFVLSTTNGTNNWFYGICKNGSEDRNEFYIYRPSYLEHPDYKNEKWLKNQKEVLGVKGFMQEVEGVFAGGSEHVCSVQEAMQGLREVMVKDKNYVLAWCYNVVRCATEEGVDITIANKIASRFMKLTFEVDVGNPEFQILQRWLTQQGPSSIRPQEEKF
jgi:hypothetical protein